MSTDKITSTFRAFRNRNYSLFFTGQSISQIGTWMQRTGVSWMVYTMTHSAFMLGLTVFASQFPSFLFSLLGGIASDRYNRYKVLLITQTASMIQAVLLAVLVLINHYTVWEILALSVVLGIVNAFDVPARQPLIHEMVTDKADLPNALALNSSMVNIARLVGPALSGIILVKYGAGACFLINAISFIAVIISLLLMKLPAYIPPSITKKVGSELVEGFVYLKNTPSISVMMLMLGLISLLILPYNTLLPVFAKVIFKGDAATFGYINSFIGLGAVAGSVFLASLKPNADLKIVLLINSIIFGICLIFFSHISYFPLAMLFAALSGFGMMSQTTIFITIIQVESDKAMRGRVMSYVAMAYFGMLPIGSLLIGAISQQIGAPNAILCQGIIALIIVAAFYKFLTSGRRDKANAEQLKEAEETEVEQV
ncbi:MFS transporter [Mucilaginibacter sp. X5P1]|uniref:MFS transporter n=1 Tax=Mucilaginibacter sp. X5P1 TaxID=2723088 RepID=UPI001619562E|nr:MFS transporter [Mucilaginibacter sp. X5P1]MBB6137880.1 MFS family permease [Mucilaginibacter sp. X5P1]